MASQAIRQFGHVRQMDDHHVATPNARICEPGSEALNVRLERLVGQRPIARQGWRRGWAR